MKIRTKLLLMLGLLSLLVFGVVFINYMAYSALESDSTFVNLSGSLRFKSYKMAYMLEHLAKDTSDTAIAGRMAEEIEGYEKILKGLREGDDALGLAPLESGAIKSQLEEIDSLWTSKFKTVFSDGVDGVSSASLNYISGGIDDYVLLINTVVGDYSALSTAKVSQAKGLSIIFFVISLLVVAGSLVIISRGVISPINTIKEQLKEISSGNGDLTRIIKNKSRDETGKLTEYFNSFSSRIRDIVVQITSSSQILNDSMGAISSTSDELAKSTEMIATAVQDVSIGSIEQTEMVNQLTSLVDAMSGEINNVLLMAQQLKDASESTKNQAFDGNETIKRQAEELQVLAATTLQVSDNVNSLENYSKDIRGIIEIIDSISKQTNLLALNASIEAARAGDAGKGFSVVADEIRKLAEETAKSTVRIVGIINSITTKSKEVKHNMDEMVEKINLHGKSMNDVQGKLDKIVEKSEGTFGEARAIELINHGISKNFVKINESALRISRVVEKNSDNTQDVAAAVEEQTASFQEVAANLSSLNQLSAELKAIVSVFRV